jgi:tetratricopeptide (TPR) repeat protein
MCPEVLSEEDEHIKQEYTKPAKALRLAGKFREAIDLLLVGLEQNPDHPRIMCSIGQVHFESGDLDKAEMMFMEALKANPNSKSAMNSLGNVLSKKDNPAAAIECYKKTLEIDKDNPWALAGLAKALYRSNDLDKARSSYMTMLEENPDNITAIIGLAKIAMRESDIASWEKWARMAMDIDPNSHVARFLMASYYFEIENFDEAMALASNLLKEKNINKNFREKIERLAIRCIYK